MQTLIILHGWQSSKEKWQKVKKELGFFFRQGPKEPGSLGVTALNLPGFQPETALNRPWKLDDYVNWLKDLVEVRPLLSRGLTSTFSASGEPFFLLGHSFGGRVAIKFAVKYPEKIKGLVLVSSAGVKDKSLLVKILKKTSVIKKAKRDPISDSVRDRVSGKLKAVFYKYILRRTDYLKAKGNLKQTMANVVEEDLAPLLNKIQAPTLIIWGKKDKITPLKDAYLMKQKIPNSRLEVLEDIGHSPHLENPRLLAEKISNFIQFRHSEASGAS